MTAAQGRIASILAEQGSLAESRRIFGLTLEMWRETGDKSGEGTALNNIGESLWKMGDLAGARRWLEQAVALFRGIGSRRGTAFSLFNLGFVLLDQGELAEAQQKQEESLALSRAIGDLSLAAVALQGLGQTQMARGELAAARRSFEEALRIRIGHSERGRAAETTLAVAALELEERRLLEAEASARVAIQEFALQKAPHYEALAQAVLGRTLVGAGKVGEALGSADRALALVERTEYRPVRITVRIAAARVRAGADRPAEAITPIPP
jgi:tetratricopeptide (TPR) repeat protein